MFYSLDGGNNWDQLLLIETVNGHDVNVLDSFKKIANDLDEQIENQRDKFRESLVKKGIDERNSVLIKSNGELNN